MGQRHQAYVIARIRAHNSTKPTYRCIAAWHHQWCYGILPVLAARRFIELAKVKENAEVIREELRAIEGRFGAHTIEQPTIGEYPCPFSTFLLGMAFNVDVQDDVYASNSGIDFFNSALDARMSPGGTDNDDGITVFDVTDPTNPSYCHAMLYHFAPITAKTYAGEYHENLTEELEAFFSIVKLIPRAALAEAWPSDVRLNSKRPSQAPQSDTSDAIPLPSLSDLALKPAIEQAIADGNMEPLGHFAWSPEKAALITSILRDRSGRQSPLEPTAVTLLSKVIEANPITIDLSDFTITSDQIMEVLASLNSDQAIHYLNLSHNTNVTSGTLRSLLVAHPLIRRLVLYGTSIADEDIDALLSENRSLFHHVDQLIHPSVFSFTERKTSTPAFSFYVTPGVMACNNALSLPILNPTMILQALSDLFKAWIMRLEHKTTRGGDLGTSHTASLAIFSSAPREEGRKWSQRAVISFPLPAENLFSEGWLFMFNMSAMTYNPSYGFLRPKHKQHNVDAGYEIHDFDSFIVELKREGYPEPPAGLVEEVGRLLQRLKEGVSPPPKTSSDDGDDGDNDTQSFTTPSAMIYSLMRSLGLGGGGPVSTLKLVTKEQIPRRGEVG
ncbi:hypothetical protein V5O48_002855 [Marasmius crinis-equi]|uniref:Uncharacterized protein n=1 Tax=Marasmius crinis-equi TaxID=585013 RepID=A0ABR3FUK5_9AGAR